MINHPRRSAAKKAAVSSQSVYSHDDVYSDLLDSVKRAFAAATATGDKLFTTDAKGLYDLYLGALPFDTQTHNCNACRRFIENFGGLVRIDEHGDTLPVLWSDIDDAPDFYRSSLLALYSRVKTARVTGVFLTKQKVWGLPVTGNWSHLAVVPPSNLVYREGALTDFQAVAAAKENFRTVAMALTEFTAPMLDEALRLLQADALVRSEKFIGPAKWLRALHDRPKGRKGENMLWRAIADAPEGYCHPKASVIGPLLDDIATGLPFAEIKKRFDAKMHPLAYQRPQAAPTTGNIKAAEAIVAKLGIGPSLERRFARLEDLQTTWTPKASKEVSPGAGVFGHLQSKGTYAVPPVTLPMSTMTWEKFSRTMLPHAEQLELRVPGRGRFIALTTAVHADAPPILKWDYAEERNPVAWYVYPGGSVANQWGLTGGSWTKVEAAASLPTLWGSRPSPFLGLGVVLVLQGAADTNLNAGNALFPECLKEELHAVRSTIEAYSRSAVLAGRAEATACGYDVRKDAADCDLRTLINGAWTAYHIDRWD